MKIMKVKIKNKIYDSDNEPIMIILSPMDKLNINHMNPSADRYCSFPKMMHIYFAKKFMEIEGENNDGKFE